MTKFAEVERAEQLSKYTTPSSAEGLNVDYRSTRFDPRYRFESDQTISITTPDGTVTDFAFSSRSLRAIAQEQTLGNHAGIRTTLDWTHSPDDHTKGKVTQEHFDGSNIGEDPLYEYYLRRHATHIPSYVERAMAIALAEQPPAHHKVTYEGGRFFGITFFDREGARTYHTLSDTAGKTNLIEHPVASNPAMRNVHETPIETFYRRAHQYPVDPQPNDWCARNNADSFAYSRWRDGQNRKRKRDVIPVTGRIVVVRGIKIDLNPNLGEIISSMINHSGLETILDERARTAKSVEAFMAKPYPKPQ